MNLQEELQNKEEELRQAQDTLFVDSQWLTEFKQEIYKVEDDEDAMDDYDTRQLMSKARGIDETHSMKLTLIQHNIKSLTRQIQTLKSQIQETLPISQTVDNNVIVVPPVMQSNDCYTGPITRYRNKKQ